MNIQAAIIVTHNQNHITSMAAIEAKDFYYDKGRSDYMGGFYDQPFPSPMLLELDEFEILCNLSYNKGYNDEREGRGYHPPVMN